MAPTAAAINEMLDSLNEEDYRTAVRFIEYLSTSRKQEKREKSKVSLLEIQNMFKDDKGGDSEQSMLEEMAAFRRERAGL